MKSQMSDIVNRLKMAYFSVDGEKVARRVLIWRKKSQKEANTLHYPQKTRLESHNLLILLPL